MLDEFYKDLQKWIDDEFKNHPYFVKYAGICLNAGLYAMHNNIDKDVFVNLLKQEFTKDNLDNEFPFNNYHKHYMMEGSDKFQNKKRLEWLNKKANI